MQTFNLNQLDQQAKREVDRLNKSDKSVRRSYAGSDLLIVDGGAVLRVKFATYDPAKWEMRYGSKRYEKTGHDCVDLTITALA